MSQDKNLLVCYNRGCLKKFDPNHNSEDDCQHHPGFPVFHNAYKKWSCCSKMCIDFTEFLNVKGCTKSRHSNIKPPEPKTADELKTNKVIAVISRPLNSTSLIKRPASDFPLTTVQPIISPTILEEVARLTIVDNMKEDENIVHINQSCKNNSCKGTYQGQESNNEFCIYHPGLPIFHEGMKYWSCCQKKTTDFTVFLEQPGCAKGKHLWTCKDTNEIVKCRMDWHQTEMYVIVSVYAKKYDPYSSFIKLNPIRLIVNLHFPEKNHEFNLDLELKEIIDETASSVNMLPTKVEIKLSKKEPLSWSRLDFRREAEMENLEDP